MRKTSIYFIFILLITSTSCRSTSEEDKVFIKALPVWAQGRELEKNLSISFLTEFTNPGDQTKLRITGSSLYRIYLNNEFIGHGPARAGHGYYRVDLWDLTEKLMDSVNTVRIEVASYNVNSYYLLDQPGFIQAEVVSKGVVLAATSDNNGDFQAFEMTDRVQKVPRYSFQRPFIEYYRIKEEASDKELSLKETGPKNLIPRRIPYPDFDIVLPKSIISMGKVKTGIKRENYWRDRAVTNIGSKLGGFPENELEYNPSIELQEMENSRKILQLTDWSTDSLPLKDNDYVIIDFGTNLTGFIGAEIEVHDKTRVFFTFDEILQDEDVNFKRLGTIAAVTYDLAGPSGPGPGSMVHVESFEPYTFRYLKIIVPKGSVTIKDVYLREYANPDVKVAAFQSDDSRLNRIFDAGVETFRQNAVDIFMDCPHRERAGWLCDSYFTARVAQDLSGNSLIEKNFYENYLLPDSFPHLPEGMLPMCYPADHNDSVFIPNWAMWFVVELEEYLDRSMDMDLVNKLEPKIMALLDYFEAFKNEDGLLENLDSWIFVEWSAANRFVQDVNYPTNMLYAKTLEVAGKLYGNKELVEEAEDIRQVIRNQSFNGNFFVDNSRRLKAQGTGLKAQGTGHKAQGTGHKGDLEITDNTTEVCQYFAFYFDIANPDTHPELWQKLSTEFGPNRVEKELYPKVHPANSFVGNYLRLELLSRYGLQDQILKESLDYFDYMAVRTGTLWENTGAYASCNHGFASHIVHVFYRDILGIKEVNNKTKTVTFKIPDVELNWCKGQMPLGSEIIKFEWEKVNGEIKYEYKIPENYKAKIID